MLTNLAEMGYNILRDVMLLMYGGSSFLIIHSIYRLPAN